MQRLKPYAFDLLIVAAALGGMVEMALAKGPDAPTEPKAVLVPAVLAWTLPLLARRRFPFAAPALVLAVLAAVSFYDGRATVYTFTAFVAALAALFLFGMRPDRSQALAGLALGLAASAIAMRNDPQGGYDDLLFTAIIFSLVWVAGFALRHKLHQAEAAVERAARAEHEREERAGQAVAEERARIARELHDLVGHSVSVMTVQASAVRRLLLPEQEKEREALLTVEQTGREALSEMRRLVGVLRRPEEAPALAPQPSLEQLDRLIAQVEEAGLPVELRIEGERIELPADVDLAAYRLVQEGLTNALKHAGAARAEVLVRFDGAGIEVQVTDDGRGEGPGDGGGHGLIGLRERIAVYGGELDAGPRPGGGYVLRGRLPVALG